MATPDYYNILGVSRKASQAEIKKAYRALAMQYHPDRNQGDKVAEARFKELTAAYRCLSDPEERSRYDRLGPLYNADGRPPRPDELNEVVSTVWGNLFRRRKNQKGDDLRYTISLTLEEVATGLDKEIVVPRQVRCATCGGDGADPTGGRETCAVCEGSGRAGPRILGGECFHCDGRGYRIDKACPECDGEGRLSIQDRLKVKVPPGVATGQKLKLGGKGNAPPGDGPHGDLYVIVSVAEHPLFQRRGDDVLVEMPLTFAEVALGTDLVVPTLEGTTTIRIPPGTPPGKVFRLAQRGLPRVGRNRRGDLHLEVTLEVPGQLDASHRDTLRSWADTLPDATHPERAAFDAAVQERT